MSIKKNPGPSYGPKLDIKQTLDSMLDFGPPPEKSPLDASERIRRLVKQIQEINRRIDHLASRY